VGLKKGKEKNPLAKKRKTPREFGRRVNPRKGSRKKIHQKKNPRRQARLRSCKPTSFPARRKGEIQGEIQIGG